MLIIGGVVIFMNKDAKTFIIILVVMFLLYFISGTPYEDYSIYVAALGILIYMILNKKSWALNLSFLVTNND